MKKTAITLALLIIAVCGLFYFFKRSLSQQPSETSVTKERVTLAKTDNWLAWLQKRFPDESKTLWRRETRESLEKIIARDGTKWNFVWRGDIHRNGRPTALLMSTQNTRTHILAVKELKVMDCREGGPAKEGGNTVPNDHGIAIATGCKWVELLRLDAEGYFRNNIKIEMCGSDTPDGYYISFSSYDSPFVICTGRLDPEGNIIPIEGYCYEFEKNKDSYMPDGEPAKLEYIVSPK